MKHVGGGEKDDLRNVIHAHSLRVSLNQSDLWLKLQDAELKQRKRNYLQETGDWAPRHPPKSCVVTAASVRRKTKVFSYW